MRSACDIVIIGGGCMGASTAYHLARLGLTNVVLIERETQLGAGSTGRNAGGVRHQFASAINVRLSMESIAAMARFHDEVGGEVDLRQDGYLFLLSSRASVEAFEASVALQRSLGVDVAWLDARAAATLAPGLATDGVLAATWCAQDGLADPGGLTLGYARAAQAAGVTILRATDAVAIEVTGGRVTAVDTTRGRIATGVVVNAAGPWARSVGAMAGLEVPVDPLRRHIFLAQPAGGGTWDAAAHRGRVPATRVMVIDFDSSFYFHREGGRVLFGMGDPSERFGFDTTVRWDFLPEVIEAATRRLPVLADAEISHAWAGLYEMTPDAMPIVGPTPVGGFLVVAGFSGHGFQHAPAAGRIVADLVAGRDPDLDMAPFAFGRFADGNTHAERFFV